jgi:cytochrome c oxidase subunit III
VSAVQFNTLEQEHEAAHFGMWVFLATEVMLFGGLFTAYTFYRTLYPLGFAEGSRHMDLTLGTLNTIILLISSGSMALAVDSARRLHLRAARRFLLATAVLGLIFLAVKVIEYRAHALDGLVPGLLWSYDGPFPSEVQLFMYAYFTMTGLHAVHLTIAIGVVAYLLLTVRGEGALPARHTRVEVSGLYWHFVDILWVFLWPLLYLYGVR